MRPLTVLSVLEARVLGVLVEKERTVPDTYPLTLNALTAGCNQKTSRDPVLEATNTEVQSAVDVLRRADFVFESSGGRVMRYSQNLKRVLELSSEKVALLVTLMLRGPQTAAELRLNCERLHRFADVSSIEAYLDELARREAGALVAMLARQPGTREHRWMHLLCGPAAGAEPGTVSLAEPAVAAGQGTERHPPASANTQWAHADADRADLAERLARVEQELAELRAALSALTTELGIGPVNGGAGR